MSWLGKPKDPRMRSCYQVKIDSLIFHVLVANKQKSFSLEDFATKVVWISFINWADLIKEPFENNSSDIEKHAHFCFIIEKKFFYIRRSFFYGIIVQKFNAW